MAPLKPVPSLYSLCSNKIIDVVSKSSARRQNPELRETFINYLPAAVRDHLLALVALNLRNKESDLLDYIYLFGDRSSKVIQLREFRLAACKSRDLFHLLDALDITGLHEFTIRVAVDLPVRNGPLRPSGLHKPLANGLASSLRSLTLYNAADNLVLQILGQCAVSLSYLDITSSWNVDDHGMANLLLKDEEMSLPWEDLEIGESLDTLSKVTADRLTACCRTLTEVKIQDTNTSTISLLLLLVFVKNLKSLGGYLYDRNMGDAVVSVQSRKGAPPFLALSELWDTHIPPKKMARITKMLPNLTHLYTQATCLPTAPGLLPPITHLSADFDFAICTPGFLDFLSFYGTPLRKLILIDQVYCTLDLVTLAVLCPNLVELSARVTAKTLPITTKLSMPNLKIVKARMTTSHPFTWIMKKADNIERLEVILERDGNENEQFEVDVIQRLIQEKPKSLDSIRVLSLHLFWSTGFHGNLFSLGSLPIDVAYALCAACRSLKLIGELHTWFEVSTEDIEKLAKHIKASNWDVKVRFQEILYP